MSVEVKVERAPGIKCPRCWNYHTVQGNPMDVCDRCVVAVTSMLEWLVAEGRWTQADADEWRALVKASVDRWKAKPELRGWQKVYNNPNICACHGMTNCQLMDD